MPLSLFVLSQPACCLQNLFQFLMTQDCLATCALQNLDYTSVPCCLNILVGVVMSALQVEWITFTSARETIIKEVSRQLNLEDDLQLHTVVLDTTPGGADQESSFFVRIFQWFIPSTYQYDFLKNIEIMQVLILPPVLCILCLFVASGIDAFDSLMLYPMLVTVTILILIATLNVLATLRYKKAERFELKDQVYGILEHYSTSIESSNTKRSIGSFLDTQPVSPPAPVSTRSASASVSSAATTDPSKIELNSGNSHVCIVSVYREKQWQRLPSLLLVKGDIISLMVCVGEVGVRSGQICIIRHVLLLPSDGDLFLSLVSFIA